MWIEILKKEVAAKGPKQVAHELRLSRSTVDLVVQGKYGASTKKIMERVEKIYGHQGGVKCPLKGLITPVACAEYYRLARELGLRAGNPETVALRAACLRCETRK